MEFHLPNTHLDRLIQLSVWEAAAVFDAVLRRYYTVAGDLPLEEIDRWVEQQPDAGLKERWAFQRRRKYPHLFFYWLFWDAKERVMRAGSIARVRPVPALGTAQRRQAQQQLEADLGESLLRLPFYDAPTYLGSLAGAWILACPEATIRASGLIEDFGRQRADSPDPSHWDVPTAWSRETSDEIRLCFVLDYLLYRTFEPYESNNVEE